MSALAFGTARTRSGTGNAARRLGVLIFFFLYALPIFWMLLTSVKSDGDVLRRPSVVFVRPTLDSYRAVIDNTFWLALRSSLVIAAGTTVLTLILALLAANALSRVAGLGPSLVLGLLITLQMVPPASAIIPLYRVLGQWHLLNTLLGVIIANSAGLLPFAIMLLRPFFLGVPAEVEEAGIVDGAGSIRMFHSIVLPMVKNGATTVAILVFMISFGDFLFSITFLSDPSKYPLTALLAQQLSFTGVSWNRLMAIAALGAVPIVLLYLFSSRRLTEGLALGAGK